MAAVQDIYGTGISGKVGKVVFCQRNGKTYVRSLPVKKSGPGTPNQQLQRQRFGELMKYCRQFKFVVIPQIWNLASPTGAGFQLFMKTNKVAFGPAGQLDDLRLIKLSAGKLHLPLELTAQRQGEGSAMISVSWVKDPNSGGIPYWDELLAISSGEGQYSKIKYTGIRRGDLQGSFEIPELPCPATHLFLFFSSLDKRNYSESICVGI